MKKTQIIENIMTEPHLLTQIGEALKQGKTVVFPTETVYGLGGNGLLDEAIDAIYTAKGRPSDNPLILHISSREMLDVLTGDVSLDALALMDAFWPGPLTLVFNKKQGVSDRATGGLSTVAVRMPRHPIALAVIEAAGVPIAAPSANLSGKPSPTEAQHVIEDLFGRVDYIISDDSVDIGLESTVCDVTGNEPIILRPGSISLKAIQAVLGKGSMDPGLSSIDEVLQPKSPGMKYTHYAPEVPMVLIEGEVHSVVDYLKSFGVKDERIGLLLFQDTLDLLGIKGESLGGRQNLEQVAVQLFKNLRHFKSQDYDKILCEIPSSAEGIGEAIRNRLLKAAGQLVIKV